MAAPSITLENIEPATDSFFTIDVTNFMGKEYVPMVHDAIRMVCIQLTVQALMVLGGTGSMTFLSAEFLLILSYIILGVMLYWLVIRRFVAFV